jgi:hypothetical protein
MEKAVLLGNADAAYSMGSMAERLNNDPAPARKIYELAILCGNCLAADNYGWLLLPSASDMPMNAPGAGQLYDCDRARRAPIRAHEPRRVVPGRRAGRGPGPGAGTQVPAPCGWRETLLPSWALGRACTSSSLCRGRSMRRCLSHSARLAASRCRKCRKLKPI